MKNVLVDSGFWFALYTKKDQYHEIARKIAVHNLKTAKIIIPFPTLYETINTCFMENLVAKVEFEKVLKSNNVIIIDDKTIKDEALKETFTEESKRRNLSLVDNIIRLILGDKNYKIDSFITFNKKDFIDVCYNRNRHIEIL